MLRRKMIRGEGRCPKRVVACIPRLSPVQLAGGEALDRLPLLPAAYPAPLYQPFPRRPLPQTFRRQRMPLACAGRGQGGRAHGICHRQISGDPRRSDRRHAARLHQHQYDPDGGRGAPRFHAGRREELRAGLERGTRSEHHRGRSAHHKIHRARKRSRRGRGRWSA